MTLSKKFNNSFHMLIYDLTCQTCKHIYLKIFDFILDILQGKLEDLK